MKSRVWQFLIANLALTIEMDTIQIRPAKVLATLVKWYGELGRFYPQSVVMQKALGSSDIKLASIMLKDDVGWLETSSIVYFEP